MLNNLANISIDASGRYHLLNGKPLYSEIFERVLNFHPPGLAAVENCTGAFHINLEGAAIYSQRYQSTYGFYCDRAAVKDYNDNCFHIELDGTPSYLNRYAWCGNFQENKCVVKSFDDLFFHINMKGAPLYEERYIYAGDYRDGIAVVKRTQDGKSTHIDTYGAYIHNKWYEDLDVFHKGYARARSNEGWFHVDLKGQSLYSNRYKYLEPFYNNVAYAITHEDEYVLISESGEVILNLYTSGEQQKQTVDLISGQITAYWSSFALIYFIQLDIINLLPSSLSDLALRTSIPSENLKKLLSVVADLGYVKLESDSIITTPTGDAIKKSGFLKDAANIWWHLSKTWWSGLDLLKSIKNSFPDFKSLEPNYEVARSYQNALLGYAKHEYSSSERLHKRIKFKDKKILMVGRQSLSWAAEIYATDPSINLKVYVPAWISDPLDKQQYSFSVKSLHNIENWPQTAFDEIIFIKLMMHYDDNTVRSILSEAKAHLNMGGKVYIIEPVIGVNGSFSGLNLNMLFECGGKLRTTDEWQQLLMNSNLLITQHETIGYNSLLRIVQDIRGSK
ncbi:MAG: methyltransferase [Alphaproteobacteria bacterium]|nr:methyltransferase [Alphaproteobacteria bacterium]